MSHSFRSFSNAPTPGRFTSADIVNAARQLLDEHAVAREAATRAANTVCGNCKGAGKAPSTLMANELITCWACEGTGAANDKMLALPDLSPDDVTRLWKLNQLVVKETAKAQAGAPNCLGELFAVIKERYPTLYEDSETQAAN